MARARPTIAVEGGRGAAEVTWFDSRELRPRPRPRAGDATRPRSMGRTPTRGVALVAEQAWETARKDAPGRGAQGRASGRGGDGWRLGRVRWTRSDTDAPGADEASAELGARRPRSPSAPPLEARSEAFGRLGPRPPRPAERRDGRPGASARTLAPQFGLSDSDASAAADLAERARDLPEIAAAATADVVYRELPFAVPIDGTLTTGRIDLAYRKDGAVDRHRFQDGRVHRSWSRARCVWSAGCRVRPSSRCRHGFTFNRCFVPAGNCHRRRCS